MLKLIFSKHEIKTTQDSLNPDTLTVLAGCHSLISNQGKLLGDPIEKAIFEAYGWKYSTTGNFTQILEINFF